MMFPYVMVTILALAALAWAGYRLHERGRGRELEGAQADEQHELPELDKLNMLELVQWAEERGEREYYADHPDERPKPEPVRQGRCECNACNRARGKAEQLAITEGPRASWSSGERELEFLKVERAPYSLPYPRPEARDEECGCPSVTLASMNGPIKTAVEHFSDCPRA